MKNKKATICNIISGILVVLAILSLLYLISTEGTARIIWGVTLGVSLFIAMLLSTFAEFTKRKIPKNMINSGMSKQELVDYAFYNLLIRNEDYTDALDLTGKFLVKKEVNWLYYKKDDNGHLHAMFTITTDKGEFAFQVENNRVEKLPAEIVKSIIKNSQENLDDQNSGDNAEQ